jgi:hypothetical protein
VQGFDEVVLVHARAAGDAGFLCLLVQFGTRRVGEFVLAVPGRGGQRGLRFGREPRHRGRQAEVVHPISRGLLLLRNAILTHARYEERYEFPELRAKVPAERLRTMATAVRAAEAVAPTRPHPGAELAKANVILGPPLAVVDRARDLIREATKRSDS